MNIFIAGGSGAIGRVLVPMLVAQGHRVVAMSRSESGIARLREMGAEPVIGNVFSSEELKQIVSAAKPELVIHQLTAFGATDADPLAETIRVRIEGTRNLVAAAKAAHARRMITQSISFICSPHGAGLTDETTPLYLDAPPEIRPLAHAVSELERQTLEGFGSEGVVLRYGWFYGLGTNYDPNGMIPNAVRKNRMAIIGEGMGTYSFIQLHDAALATMIALTKGHGIYNIVDDHAASVREWLPFLANLLSSPPPATLDQDAARRKLGDMFVYTMCEQRGASNTKAKWELDWKPLMPSYREGFSELYATVPR